MNPPNPSAGAPLTNKLILLVLSGILVCLVLLVIRAFDQPASTEPKLAESTAPAPEPEAEPAFVPTPEPKPIVRRAVTNTFRPPVIAVAPPTVPLEPVEEAPIIISQTVTLPAGFSQPGGSAPGGGRGSIRQGDTPAPENASVSGIVSLLGQPPREIPIVLGPSCGRFAPPATTRHYVTGPDGGLANVFIYLVDAKSSPVSGPGPLLDQINCMYEPYVLGVGVKQKFGIRNSDPEFHNVHATARVNKEFNFAQAPRSPLLFKSFDKPEVLVRLKCDVHPWMFAYIGVVDHPWFAVSDTNGVYSLPPGLPDGRYRLSAVHSKAGVQTQEISVKDSQPVAVNYQFTVPAAATPQTSQLRR